MKEFGRILVLIDTPGGLAATGPAFSQIPEGWTVHATTGLEDALCQMEQVPFDLIFVDLQAGPLASAQFLHEVWARHPRTIRFLMAEVLEPDLMVTCALGPHQFLYKPLEPGAVRAAIERAGLVDCLFQEKDAQALVSRLRTFPARPTVYVEVMKELRSSNASPMTVGELVSKDLAISAKLLQITNSAFFGFHQTVSTPAEAVLLLGMETTASLTLGIEAFAKLDDVKLLLFSSEQVWRHCQSVANGARAIADFMTDNPSLAQEAFTAALLHDLGKLALAVNLEEQYGEVAPMARQHGLPEWEVERHLLGATHADAGAYLLALWGLPAGVIEAVAGHHLPARQLAPKFSAMTALHLANTLEHIENRRATGADVKEAVEKLGEYPAELKIAEHFDTLQQLARTASRPTPGITAFIRKNATEAAEAAEARSVPQMPLELPTHGWWARFRSLLAA